MQREGEARWLPVANITSIFDSLVSFVLWVCSVEGRGRGGGGCQGWARPGGCQLPIEQLTS